MYWTWLNIVVSYIWRVFYLHTTDVFKFEAPKFDFSISYFVSRNVRACSGCWLADADLIQTSGYSIIGSLANRLPIQVIGSFRTIRLSTSENLYNLIQDTYGLYLKYPGEFHFLVLWGTNLCGLSKCALGFPTCLFMFMPTICSQMKENLLTLGGDFKG